MELNQIPFASDQVAARVVDGSAVIVLADSGQVNILNGVGTRVWELANGSRTIAQICAAIQTEYAVTVEQAQRDVTTFVQSLVDAGALALRADPKV